MGPLEEQGQEEISHLCLELWVLLDIAGVGRPQLLLWWGGQSGQGHST